MESAIFANIKKLYDCELYSSVIPTASLLISLLENDRTAATPEMEYQALLFYGYAFYYERNYRLAIKQLDPALLMRKVMVRYKNSQLKAIESSYEQFTEVETRYRLAICYREVGEHNLALSVLQVIPAKSRTPKVNMLLATLLHYGRAANTTEAAVAYKDVLRECPMALQAVDALLQLGVDGIEANSLVVNASPIPRNIEWLSTWIKGHAQMYGRKHLEAAKTFQVLNDTTKFHQNEILLTLIGKCQYYYGNFAQAQHYLETASMINPHNMEAIMSLSVVYEYRDKHQELEKLASRLTNINEFSSEHWFVLAQGFYATGKLEKASSFTHKAISVNPRNIEATLLRGKICLQLKRHNDGICFFRAAQCIANYRFEVYKGLYHCYVGLKRLKEAHTMCALAIRYFPNSPRSCVMFARALLQSPNLLARKGAKKFVSKALEIDEYYAPAAALMAEICQSEGEAGRSEAVTMLKKQVVNCPNHKLFTMLGDILSTQKDLNGALEYYTIALNLEPTYHRALEGVNALGHASRSNATAAAAKQEQDTSMTNTSTAHDEEWSIECDEPSMNEAVELSSPAVAHDGGDGAESDTFSDPFWQDVDAELTN